MSFFRELFFVFPPIRVVRVFRLFDSIVTHFEIFIVFVVSSVAGAKYSHVGTCADAAGHSYLVLVGSESGDCCSQYWYYGFRKAYCGYGCICENT